MSTYEVRIVKYWCRESVKHQNQTRLLLIYYGFEYVIQFVKIKFFIIEILKQNSLDINIYYQSLPILPYYYNYFMIKVEGINSRGFLKRSWKDERKLKSKLKVGNTDLLENANTNVQPQTHKSKVQSIWGSLKKFGSSIVNRFKRENPDVIVNSEFLQIGQNVNKAKQFVDAITMTQEDQEVDKKMRLRYTKPLDLSVLKKPSISEYSFIQPPRKKRVNQENYYTYRISEAGKKVFSSSKKRDIEQTLNNSIKAQKIINDLRIKRKDHLTDSFQSFRKKRDQQSNNFSNDKNVGVTKRILEKQQTNGFSGQNKLEWLNKLAQQQNINQALRKNRKQQNFQKNQQTPNTLPSINASKQFSFSKNDTKDASANDSGELPPSTNTPLFQSKQPKNTVFQLPNTGNVKLQKPFSLFNNNTPLLASVDELIPKQPIDNSKIFGKEQKIELFQSNQPSVFLNKAVPETNNEPSINDSKSSNKGLFFTAEPKTSGSLFENINIPASDPEKKKSEIEKPQEQLSQVQSTPKKIVADFAANPLLKSNEKPISPIKQIPLLQTPAPEVSFKQNKSSILSSINKPKVEGINQSANVFLNVKDNKTKLNFIELFGDSPSSHKDGNSLNNPFQNPQQQNIKIPQQNLINNPWGNSTIPSWALNSNFTNNFQQNNFSSGGMDTQDISQGIGFNQPQIVQAPSSLFFNQNPQNASSNTVPAPSFGFNQLQQARYSFQANMMGQNLGAGMIAGASSFFIDNSKKQPQTQGLFGSSTQESSPNKSTFGSSNYTKSKSNKSKQQRAFG